MVRESERLQTFRDYKGEDLWRELTELLKKESNIEKRNQVLFKKMKEALTQKGFSSVVSYEAGGGTEFNDDAQSIFQNPDDYKNWDRELLWRGDDPRYLLPLVLENKKLELDSEHFNVAGDHQVSISYSGDLREKENEEEDKDEDKDEGAQMFNLCIGFLPSNGGIDFSKPKEITLAGVYEVQKDMLRYRGEISFDDIQYVVVRSRGTGPGQVGRTYMFSKPKLKQEAQRQAA